MTNQFSYILQDDYQLPTTATTSSGVVFDPRQPRWSYRDGTVTISLDFTSLPDISADVLLGLKRTFLWYAENMAPHSVKNQFWRMKNFLTTIFVGQVITEITSTDLMNYLAQIDKEKHHRLGALASFLKKWHALGVPGITKDAVDFLNDIRLKGNLKGAAVSTLDPTTGPFTDIERKALRSALDNAYVKGEVDIGDYLLCLLMMFLGRRPSQYAQLKICDIKKEQKDDASFVYILRVPRAKQRETPRSSFKECVLRSDVGALLVTYSETVKKHFAGHIEDVDQAPLFPMPSNRSDYPDGFHFHRTTTSVTNVIKKVFDKLGVFSERTGEPIHITTRRFRYTVGTHAAAEGWGALVIAELLDHSNTDNVSVYVEAVPEIIERIDRALATKMAPLAQAFAGMVVDGKTEQDVSPAQRITAPKYSNDFSPVGTCGQHSFCGFAAPIACYVCPNFNAWLDGPHEAVLNHLIAERERLMQAGKERIAQANDHTILAVAQVVEMCKVQSAELNSGALDG